MFRLIFYFLPIVYCFIAKHRMFSTRKLYSIRILDHDIENKTIYDKFEYYSMIGDRVKQKELMDEILRNITKK